MARVFVTLLMVGVVWLTLRRLVDYLGAHRQACAPPPSVPRFEKTVRCARCGAHTPMALVRADGDGYICRVHDGQTDGRARS